MIGSIQQSFVKVPFREWAFWVVLVPEFCFSNSLIFGSQPLLNHLNVILNYHLLGSSIVFGNLLESILTSIKIMGKIWKTQKQLFVTFTFNYHLLGSSIVLSFIDFFSYRDPDLKWKLNWLGNTFIKTTHTKKT